MKKIIALFMGLMMVSLASAINVDEGDVVTQQALDNLDLDTLHPINDFKCRWESASFSIDLTNRVITAPFSCLTIMPTTTEGYYLVVRVDEDASVSYDTAKKVYRYWRQQGESIPEATVLTIDWIGQALSTDGKRWFNKMVDHIRKYQTQEELSFDFGDLDLTFT